MPSLNKDIAQAHADSADLANDDLQGQLMATEPDQHRIDALRAAAEYHQAAALTYAVLALVETQEPDQDGPAARSATGLASELARRGRPAGGAPVSKRPAKKGV